MTDLSDIPTNELLADLAESIADIRICELALVQGVTHYSVDKSVNYRLKINKQIVTKIEAELNRRAVT